MQGGKAYLRWCSRQSKGIRILKPSDNLAKAYLKKAANALKSMELNAGAGIDEWAVSAAYYARYFAVYALLSKIGVKCEIHDCTIALFEHLFKETVRHDLIDEIKLSKEDRVESQYYPRENKIDLSETVAKAKEFVLEIERLADGMNPQQAETLRRNLRSTLA